MDKRKQTKAQKKKALLLALEKTMGVVTSACVKCGLSRQTYYDYYNSDEKFKIAADDIQNIALDFVESKLYEQIQTGNVASTIFYLKTKGKNRGYIERTEQDINHNVESITIKPFNKDKE